MKTIKELSTQIQDEIEGAEWYIMRALQFNDEHPELAQTLYDISTDELRHVNLLHSHVVKIIEDYRKKHGEPPASMLAVYEFLHEKQIEDVNEVRMYQSQFREGKS